MFFINLKIALRNLKKNKSFSVMNIGGLAIGMTCCLLLLLYVSYEWGYDKQFRDIDRIFISRVNIDVNGQLATTIANPDRLAGTALQTLPGVEQASRMDLGGNNNKLFYYDEKISKTLIMRVNPAENLSVAVNKIKEISGRLNPAYPSELTFVAQDLKDKLKSERLLSILSNFFGGFAIFISCLGLLGLALYMAEQRKKEISIRKVLGADLKSILILLNKDFIKLVMISNLVAFPVAFVLANHWLKSYDYKISIAAEPFIIAAIMSLGIALVTVSLQSFKVAKANAVDALKYE